MSSRGAFAFDDMGARSDLDGCAEGDELARIGYPGDVPCGGVRWALIRGLRHGDIVSGAGHDAVYLARVAPTGMIFVPCAHGISHNELEKATPEDLAAGTDVLLQAMLEHAG